VELQLSGRNSEGYKISGITQNPLYGQQFDSSDDLGVFDLTNADLNLGHAGYGLPVGLPQTWTASRLRPELIRSADDSFVLECTYIPPSDLQDIIAQNIDFITLLSVDVSGSSTPLLDLGLVPPLDYSTTPPTQTIGTSWKIVAGDPANPSADLSHNHQFNPQAFTRIGALYRQKTLHLFINGEPIIQRSWHLPANPPYTNPIALAMGHSSVAAPDLRLGTIDNVQLLRLGNSNAVSLPALIEPQSEYRITIYPDGSIIGNSSWQLNYTGSGESNYHNATINISAQGHVSISKPLVDQDPEPEVPQP
jgi:hypothetical protein